MCQHSGRYEIDERGHPDEEWKTTSELKISRLEKTDLGEYTCSASSSMGKAEATLRVYGESAHTYTIDEHCHFSTTAIPWKIPVSPDTLTSRDSCSPFEPSTRITNKLRYRTLYNVHVPSFVFARESKNAPSTSILSSRYTIHDIGEMFSEIERATIRTTSASWKLSKGKSKFAQVTKNRVFHQMSTPAMQKSTVRIVYSKHTITSTTVNPRAPFVKDENLFKNRDISNERNCANAKNDSGMRVYVVCFLFFLTIR